MLQFIWKAEMIYATSIHFYVHACPFPNDLNACVMQNRCHGNLRSKSTDQNTTQPDSLTKVNLGEFFLEITRATFPQHDILLKGSYNIHLSSAYIWYLTFFTCCTGLGLFSLTFCWQDVLTEGSLHVVVILSGRAEEELVHYDFLAQLRKASHASGLLDSQMHNGSSGAYHHGLRGVHEDTPPLCWSPGEHESPDGRGKAPL